MRQLSPSLLAVLREISQEAQICDPDPDTELGEDYEPPQELLDRKLIMGHECVICSEVEGDPVDHFRLTDLGRAALLIGSVS